MKSDSFTIFGHQGAAGYAPENTLLSFEEAIQRGADFIELDVHQVANELIVIHDYRLERTTNGDGIIYDKSIKYLRSLDAGKGERIPLLTEVLNLVDKRIGVNIELKSPGTAKPVMELVNRYIKNHSWSIDHFIISSFDQHELLTLRQLRPTIKIGVLMFGIPLDHNQIVEALNPFSINISIEFVNRQFIAKVHELGLRLFVFTANFPDDIRRMLEWGADGIFTDFPDRAKQIVSNPDHNPWDIQL
jgi:glycerophosphoryl diester phosphodiesterase